MMLWNHAVVSRDSHCDNVLLHTAASMDAPEEALPTEQSPPQGLGQQSGELSQQEDEQIQPQDQPSGTLSEEETEPAAGGGAISDASDVAQGAEDAPVPVIPVPVIPPRSRVRCKHWARGHCQLGESCRFGHTGIAGEGPVPMPPQRRRDTSPQPQLSFAYPAAAAGGHFPLQIASHPHHPHAQTIQYTVHGGYPLAAHLGAPVYPQLSPPPQPRGVYAQTRPPPGQVQELESAEHAAATRGSPRCRHWARGWVCPPLCACNLRHSYSRLRGNASSVAGLI